MALMVNVDREYESKPSWVVIALCAVFFGAGAAILGYIAATNDRGLVINGILPLSRDGATVFDWSLCALSIGFVVIAAIVAARRLKYRQRIAFTPQSLVVPVSRSSTDEIVTNYADMPG